MSLDDARRALAGFYPDARIVDLPMGETLRVTTRLWSCDGSSVDAFITVTTKGHLRVSDAAQTQFLASTIGYPTDGWEDLVDSYGLTETKGIFHRIVDPASHDWSDHLVGAVDAVACFTIAALGFAQARARR